MQLRQGELTSLGTWMCGPKNSSPPLDHVLQDHLGLGPVLVVGIRVTDERFSHSVTECEAGFMVAPQRLSSHGQQLVAQDRLCLVPELKMN